MALLGDQNGIELGRLLWEKIGISVASWGGRETMGLRLVFTK